MDDLIQEILGKYHINEPCVKLATHGIANDIYATPNFILRIPTNHPEAASDALTESVAAPLAKSNGIKTPELIYFDNSYTMVNKTYSIWERIQGLTLGEIDHYLHYYNTWREIGFELGKLHVTVKSCNDPNCWLGSPDRDYTKDMLIQGLLNYERESSYLLELIKNKFTDETFSYKKSFVHGDTNEFNFLCTKNDKLLSVIDWGDSGWGDPAIDFYMIPIEILQHVLDGYNEIAGANINNGFIDRIILDKVWTGIEEGQNLRILEKNIMELESRLFSYISR
ncbi:aminoglycoside phosphotransferase family protein [Lacrimispora sp.]|uniref:aminoglycoside phosphotransferase family protein n=1 Tax=Lacrimispora sp. TaxID=2719234 RepID=UPI0032E40272